MESIDTQVLRAGSIWTCYGFIECHLVFIRGIRIAVLEPWGTNMPSDWPLVDASHLMVVPGLIDLQVNGALGMAGEIRSHWLHALPKSKTITSPRINLTFRKMKPL